MIPWWQLSLHCCNCPIVPIPRAPRGTSCSLVFMGLAQCAEERGRSSGDICWINSKSKTVVLSKGPLWTEGTEEESPNLGWTWGEGWTDSVREESLGHRAAVQTNGKYLGRFLGTEHGLQRQHLPGHFSGLTSITGTNYLNINYSSV